MKKYDPYNASLNYFDYNASTPCDPRVLDEMMLYLTEGFGNPHSRSHKYGWECKAAIQVARKQIAQAVHCNEKNIIFTSGATESVNMVMHSVTRNKPQPEIITSMIEHKCVIESVFHYAKIILIKPNEDGIIDERDIEKHINTNTVLVSIGYVNGEIGTIQNINNISELCKKYNILFHTDAAQALGKIQIDASKVDFMSLSSHKAYGPKGIGCLIANKRIKPLIIGGGQERNMRSGTLPTALCVGFGKAAELTLDTNEEELWKMHKQFNKYVFDNLNEVYLNGHATQRVPGNINLSFSYIEGESLIMSLQDIAVSSGSACTSASLEPSYVLRSIGVNDLLAHSSLRISFGRFTILDNLMETAKKIVSVIKKLRELSPLTDMAAQGINLNDYQWNLK